MNKFTCYLITPEEIVAQEELVMVTLPSVDGEVGLLQDHAPMLLALESGTVCFYDASLGTITKKYTISSGFAHVREVETYILVSKAALVT